MEISLFTLGCNSLQREILQLDDEIVFPPDVAATGEVTKPLSFSEFSPPAFAFFQQCVAFYFGATDFFLFFEPVHFLRM